jgi:hypothetical protein
MALDVPVFEHCADGRSGGVQSAPDWRTHSLRDAEGDEADEILFVDARGRVAKRVVAQPAAMRTVR